MNNKSILGLIFLISFSFLFFPSAIGHSMFNSAEETIGDHRVQIATLPEIPETGEVMQILFRVTDLDYEEVDRFTMGIRIFYNDQQIGAIAPQSIDGGHWEFDYTLDDPGNHVLRADLYDVGKNGGVITYTFNISTQNPFGFIFIISITIGAITLSAVVAYIYIPKLIKSKTKS